jgi:lipopolysaccharide cholinephosphotransferase
MSYVEQYYTTTYNMDWEDIFKYLFHSHYYTALKGIRCKLGIKHKRNRLVSLLENIEENLRSIKGNKILNYYTFYKTEKEIFNKDWFANTIEVPFENITINLPVGYHEYLTKLFGDYMSLPPKEKQISHHSHYYCNLKERLTLKEVKTRVNNGERYVM